MDLTWPTFPSCMPGLRSHWIILQHLSLFIFSGGSGGGDGLLLAVYIFIRSSFCCLNVFLVLLFIPVQQSSSSAPQHQYSCHAVSVLHGSYRLSLCKKKKQNKNKWAQQLHCSTKLLENTCWKILELIMLYSAAKVHNTYFSPLRLLMSKFMFSLGCVT